MTNGFTLRLPALSLLLASLFAAGGNERVTELYYRYRINKQFELSPDFQYIGAPGDNQVAAAVKIYGLRAQLGF